MAITVTNKTNAKNEANQTTYTTASVTFVANRLYVVSMVSHDSGGAANHGVTGTSSSWTAITNVAFSVIATPNKRITLFRCMPSSGFSETLTLTFAGSTQQHAHWSVDEFDGVDTSGTNGSGAIAQSLTDRSDSASSLTINLSAFASSDNVGYGFFARSENENMTPGTSFTQLAENTGTEAPTTSSLAEYRVNDNSVDCSWASAGACGGAAIEVKAAAAGGGGTFTRRSLLGVGV